MVLDGLGMVLDGLGLILDGFGWIWTVWTDGLDGFGRIWTDLDGFGRKSDTRK